MLELASLRHAEEAKHFADRMKVEAGWDFTNYNQLDLAAKYLERLRLRRGYLQGALNRISTSADEPVSADQVRDLLASRLRAAGASSKLLARTPAAPNADDDRHADRNGSLSPARGDDSDSDPDSDGSSPTPTPRGEDGDSDSDRTLTSAQVVDDSSTASLPAPHPVDNRSTLPTTPATGCLNLAQARRRRRNRARAAVKRPTSLRDAAAVDTTARSLVEVTYRAKALHAIVVDVLTKLDEVVSAPVVLQDLTRGLNARAAPR